MQFAMLIRRNAIRRQTYCGTRVVDVSDDKLREEETFTGSCATTLFI